MIYLKVLKATGEVQDVPEVSLGIPTGTCGFSLLQLLSDCIELQGSNGKDLTSHQELFSCNSHARRVSIQPQPCPHCVGQGICPPGQQLTSIWQTCMTHAAPHKEKPRPQACRRSCPTGTIPGTGQTQDTRFQRREGSWERVSREPPRGEDEPKSEALSWDKAGIRQHCGQWAHAASSKIQTA